MYTIIVVNALIEEVTDNLDSKLNCSMVSLYLSKALDTINHNILNNKFRNNGIKGEYSNTETLTIHHNNFIISQLNITKFYL